jgi:hypothetical protein
MTVTEQLKQAENLLLSDLPKACSEILESHAVGVIRQDGIVRQAANLLTHEAIAYHKITHVELLIARLAMQFVVTYKILQRQENFAATEKS